MKKYMIGFFSVLFLITGCLIAGYQQSTGKGKSYRTG